MALPQRGWREQLAPLIATAVAGGASMSAVNSTFAELDRQLAKVEAGVAQLGRLFDRLDSSLGKLGSKLDRLDGKLDRLDGKLSGLCILGGLALVAYLRKPRD